MNICRTALIFLGVFLAAGILWIGFSAVKERRGDTGQTAQNSAEENSRGSTDESGAGTDRKTQAQLRVDKEGKILEGYAEPPCIVIDPGHGGFDPGKVGVNNVPEKDVNLQIAGLVRDFLEASGVRVVMTREEDEALCDDGQDNMKVRDLKRRIAVIEEADPVATVSIHQNSYPKEYVHGAQVFYYTGSVEGRRLAEHLQSRLISEADPENDRQVKENSSYYLLKKTPVPLVIVECGFMSNWEEAQKLCTPEYRETVAWAVYLGIMDYLDNSSARPQQTVKSCLQEFDGLRAV